MEGNAFKKRLLNSEDAQTGNGELLRLAEKDLPLRRSSLLDARSDPLAWFRSQ
jgi:hypothetical protein